MERYDIKKVDREQIKVGDIILCNDKKIRTVCKKDITNDSFMGICIFGDSYKLGSKKVDKVYHYSN